MELRDIDPYIRLATDSVIRAGRVLKRRVIYDYELIYIEDGAFTLEYDGAEYPCGTGDFIFLRPGIPHSFFGIGEDLHQPHIHFDIVRRDDSPAVPICFKDRPQMTDRERAMIREDMFASYPKTPFVEFREKEAVLELFYGITNSPTSALRKKADLMLILDHLIRDAFPEAFHRAAPRYPVEKAVKDYISAGQGMFSGLDDIAKQFSYSKYHLDRKFKQAYGIGIMAYRNEKRMQLAKELLKEESVTSVAEKLGFSSVYSFSRSFKDRFGASPSTFKKRT